MTDTKLQGIFEAYLDAFAATSLAEQERMLRSSVAEDVVYSRELLTAHSYGRLNELNVIAHLAGFWSPGAV